MASSKDSKTSKTAHVMNLLSRNRGGGEPETAAAPAEPASAAAPVEEPQAALQSPPKAPAPPILTSLNADAGVSSHIKNALAAELEDLPVKEPTPPAAQAVPEPAPTQEATPPAAEPVAVEVPVPEAPIIPEPPMADISAPVPAPAAPAPAEPPVMATPPAPAEPPVEIPAAEPAPEKEPAAGPQAEAPEPEEVEEPNYVNVMQVLVEEKAEKYMEMFGICRCGMCKADVKAYALNHLKPKYVVMGQREMIPKLTFYETQNSSDITAEIIKACKVVMSRPHHTR